MVVADQGKLNLEEPPPLWGSRSVDCFEKLEQIGEGTYGYIYTPIHFNGFSKRRKLFYSGYLIFMGGGELINCWVRISFFFLNLFVG